MTEEGERVMESRWERVSIPEGEAERLFTKSRTFAGDVWFRFRRKPTALAGHWPPWALCAVTA